MLGHAQPQAGVPAGPIQHEHDLLRRTRADLTGEGGELDFEERDADAGRQVKDRPARGGVHKADEIPPGEAVPHWRHRALPDGSPDAPEEWLQADAVFIGRPHLNARRRESGRDLLSAAASAFFEGLLLFRVRQGVLRARHLRAVLEADQIAPAEPVGDRPAEALAHPGRHVVPGPVRPGGPPPRPGSPAVPPARPATRRVGADTSGCGAGSPSPQGPSSL